MRLCHTLIFASILMLGTACNTNTFTPEFLTDDTPRMEIGKKQIFKYSPSTCQYAYNSGRCEFRAHTDNMSDYFLVRLDSTPTAEGEEVNASYLKWTEKNGTDKFKKNVTMQVVKLDGEHIWLWSSRENIKLSILLP